MSAVSAALGRPVPKPTETGLGARARVDLSGQWERRIDGDLYDVVQVPSSLRPSGYYHLRREFLLPELSVDERAILHFDAITYFGRTFVNGAELGTMGPYVPYEFDFTRQAKKGSNTVEVAIADLTPDPTPLDRFGPLACVEGVNRLTGVLSLQEFGSRVAWKEANLAYQGIA